MSQQAMSPERYRSTLDHLVGAAQAPLGPEEPPLWFTMTDPTAAPTPPEVRLWCYRSHGPLTLRDGSVSRTGHSIIFDSWPPDDSAAVSQATQRANHGDARRAAPPGGTYHRSLAKMPNVLTAMPELAPDEPSLVHVAQVATEWLNTTEQNTGTAGVTWRIMSALLLRGFQLTDVYHNPGSEFMPTLGQLDAERYAGAHARGDIGEYLGRLMHGELNPAISAYRIAPEVADVAPFEAQLAAALQAEKAGILPAGFWVPNTIENKKVLTDFGVLDMIHSSMLEDSQRFANPELIRNQHTIIARYVADLLAQVATEPHRNQTLLLKLHSRANHLRADTALGQLITDANVISAPLAERLGMSLPLLDRGRMEDIAKALTRILYHTLDPRGATPAELSEMYERDMMRVELLELLRLHLRQTPESPSSVDIRLRNAAATEEEINAALTAWGQPQPKERFRLMRQARRGGRRTRDRLEVLQAHQPGYGLLS